MTKTQLSLKIVNPMIEKKRRYSGLVELFSPILILFSVGLAFAAGVLWQKVQYLEGGGKTQSSGGTNEVTNSPTPAGQPQSKLDDLASVARAVGVDVEKFNSCMGSSKYEDKVEKSYQGGISAGVNGTPGSFVVNSKGEVWNIPGAFPYENVKTVVDIALGKSGTLPQGVTKLDSAKVSSLPKVISSDHFRGNKNASVKLIEYSDFQCPYCQRFHPTMQQMLSEYSDKVAWIYRHFPLDSIHPQARPAALASECVFELGGDEAFWKFADEVLGA